MTTVPARAVLLSPPLLVFFLLYVLAGFGSPYLHELFWTSRGSFSSPPWYFIGSDLARAVLFGCSAAGSLLASWAFRHRHPEASRTAALMAILWMGYPIVQGVLIWTRTSHILDPSRAATTWQTAHDYVRDPWRWLGVVLSIGCGVLFLRMTRAAARPVD